MSKDKHDSMDLYRHFPRRQASLSSMDQSTKVNHSTPPPSSDAKKLKEVKYTIECADSASEGEVPKEPHFGGAEIVRDVVIGLSDGLTVPFALYVFKFNLFRTNWLM